MDQVTSTRVYLDYNATTPLSSSVQERLPEWAQQWGNPSSIHWAGRGPKQLLRDARAEISRLLGCDPLEVVFTSGASESNNWAIKMVMTSPTEAPTERSFGQLIIGGAEHPSVTQVADYLAQRGVPVCRVPVSRGGEVDLAVYEEFLRRPTTLVSMMFANNETGSIFPIKKMVKMAHAQGALFHCDAVQALGKETVNLKSWDVDLASFSAHKFYSLKGTGVLYIRRGLALEPLIHGGSQERRRRAGTENILGIAALGEVAKDAPLVESRMAEVTRRRDEMEAEILRRLDGVTVNGAAVRRVGNTSSLTFAGVSGESLLMSLDLMGFSVSAGSACSSGSPEPSVALRAMGLSRDEAQSTLRVSLGWQTSDADIENFVAALEKAVHRLRGRDHGFQEVET